MEKDSDYEETNGDIVNITNFEPYEDAFLKDDTDQMISLLNGDVYLCTTLTYKDDPLLHYAVRYNSMSILQMFLESGISPSIQNKKHIEPIHLAASKGNIGILNLLLRYGASATTKDDRGRSPLHYAIQGGHLSCIALFMKRGVSILERDYKGKTPLIIAAIYDQTIVFEWLLKHGARILDQDSEGNTVLHCAVQNGNLNIIKTILDNLYGKQLTRTVNFNMRTPIDIAKQKAGRYSNAHKKYQKIYSYLYGYTYHPALSTISRYIQTHTAMILVPVMIVYGIYIYYTLLHSFLQASFPQHVIIFSILCAFTLFLWIYLIFSNPGYIIDKHHQPIASLENSQSYRTTYEEIMKGQSYHSKLLCATCEIERPNRSKHCNICDTCILKMDHHCPWINNCVGIKNHRQFLLFLFFAAVILIYNYYLLYLYVEHGGQCTSTIPNYCKYLYAVSGFYFINIAWIFSYCVYLLFIQIFQISRNITTNEYINWRHYNYLLINGRTFRNPYDKGFFHNWIDFWGCSKDKYELIPSDNAV